MKSNVLVVNPYTPHRFGSLSALEPPVWAARYGYPVHDCQESALNIDSCPQEVWLIAMGANPSASSTPKMPEAIRLSKELKKTGRTVRIGGLHPWALPGLTLQETGADSILPMPDKEVDWSLLPMSIYRAHNWHVVDRSHYAALYTAYGCPFSCDFCNIKSLYKGWMQRPVDKVIDEIRLLVENYSVRNLKLCDELFTVNTDRVLKICEGIGDFNLNVWAYARVGTVNPKMLKGMKRAGINWLGYGFESFDPQVRGNKVYKNEDETICITKEAGIKIMANLIFGLPGETLDTMKRTLERALEYRFEAVNFYTFMPYPGSNAWNDSCSHDWARYDQYNPDKLGDHDVIKFRDYAFNEYQKVINGTHS